MTQVNVGATITDPTHDLALQDGTDAQVAAATATKLGLIFAGGPKVLQEIPLTPPAQAFAIEQKNWIGGRGKLRYDEDPTGFLDDYFLWSTTEGKLLPSLQWRFGGSVRTERTSLPADNNNLAWWKLYGSTPASNLTRWLETRVIPSSNITADKAYLIIRQVGTPGTLTLELCPDDGSNNPTTPVTKTVTKTANASGLIEGVGVYLVFDWTTTASLVSGTTYHLKVYGASTDNAANHWEILCNDDGTTGKYSTDGSAWTAANLAMYSRITDADIRRQWRFFFHENVLYACSQNEDGGTSVLMRNGEVGTATAGTPTTLTCSALSMTTDEYAAGTGRQAAFIRIYDGAGDGQVRQILSNTATQFTVSEAWDITPTATSRFIVYGTDRWTVIAGHGLANIANKPISTGTVAYFPQGATAIRRMRLNGNTYEFAADGTNTSNILKTHIEGTTLKVVSAYVNNSTIKLANAVDWGTNLTLGVAKTIGTSDYRITNLYSHNKTLYILKQDGVFTYNNGIVERVGSNFADIPDRMTGVGVGSEDKYLWFGWAQSIVRMLGASAQDMLNYKRGTNGMPDDRVGSVSEVVSAMGWLFFVIDGETTNYSSIIAWNGNGWHEIFRSWAPGVRIRNAIWQPCFEGRPRLWFDVGGDIAYIEYPQYTANPLQDSNSSPKGHGVNYHWTGVCITSNYDAHDPNLYKILQTLRTYVDTGSAEVDYKLNDPAGTNTGWTNLGTASTSPVTEFDLNLGEAYLVRFRVRFNTTNTRSAPVLSGWQLTGRQMQPEKYQYLATFKTESDGTTHSDEPDHDPNTLFSQLLSWARTQKKLTMRTQSNSSDSKIVTVSMPSKSVDWIDTQENKWGGRISIAILEV